MFPTLADILRKDPNLLAFPLNLDEIAPIFNLRVCCEDIMVADHKEGVRRQRNMDWAITVTC